MDAPLLAGLPLWLFLLGGIACASLGAWLTWRFQSLLRHRRMARLRRQGRDGERVARDLLAAAGCRILDEQVMRSAVMLVDGVETAYEVRADYLVLRGGRRWVAEVKAGAVVCDPAHRDTRRQLLEYRHVYDDTVGVLLVDVPAGRIRVIAFPERSRSHPVVRWRWLLAAGLAGALLGAVGAWWWAR